MTATRQAPQQTPVRASREPVSLDELLDEFRAGHAAELDAHSHAATNREDQPA